MPNNDLALQDVKDHIMTELGATGVEVELQEGDLKQCMRQALRHYNRARPGYRYAAIAVSQSVRRYPLTQAAYPGIQGIMDVNFVRRVVEPATIDPFNQYETVLSGLSVGVGGGTFAELQQQLAYAEDAARIVSAEADWNATWEENTLALYIEVFRENLDCSMLYTWHYTPDQNANTGMQFIPNGDVDWILDYSVAYAKQILSRIRGKHQGIVTPEGSTDLVDYAELAQEGREDATNLLEELRERRKTLPPVIE